MFPGGEDRGQVSTVGIRYYSSVYWSAAGDQLYYVRDSDGALIGDGRQPWHAGPPLAAARAVHGIDRRHFLVVRAGGEPEPVPVPGGAPNREAWRRVRRVSAAGQLARTVKDGRDAMTGHADRLTAALEGRYRIERA